MYRASRSRTSHRVDQALTCKATRQPSELLPVSEIPNVVVERNFLSHTSFLKPKFFFQLPQPSIFSTLVSLRQPTTRAFGKTFYPYSSYSNHCKDLYACSARLPASQADVSVIFHTSLALGSYFISPSTLRYSRYLN